MAKTTVKNFIEISDFMLDKLKKDGLDNVHGETVKVIPNLVRN